MRVALRWILSGLVLCTACKDVRVQDQPSPDGGASSEVSPPGQIPPEAPTAVPASFEGDTLEDLWDHFEQIFPTGNRNAASHRWATFLLERADTMTAQQLEFFFQGFCPVSGSPVTARAANRFAVRLPRADGEGTMDGYIHFCCWPCICDTMDFIHADTRTVTTKDGDVKLPFVVIGDPCAKEGALDQTFIQPFGDRKTTLRETAPELSCKNGRLEGATRSDHGHVIIGRLFTERTPTPYAGEAKAVERLPSEQVDWTARCKKRADEGFESGMGVIFRKAAEVAPLKP
ncbi:MAG: hypothetical protein AAF928_10325 [Myxococcota bacterium]